MHGEALLRNVAGGLESPEKFSWSRYDDVSIHVSVVSAEQDWDIQHKDLLPTL